MEQLLSNVKFYITWYDNMHTWTPPPKKKQKTKNHKQTNKHQPLIRCAKQTNKTEIHVSHYRAYFKLQILYTHQDQHTPCTVHIGHHLLSPSHKWPGPESFSHSHLPLCSSSCLSVWSSPQSCEPHEKNHTYSLNKYVQMIPEIKWKENMQKWN